MKQNLKKLIREYVYGDISEEQLQILQELLKTSPEAREFFLSEMNLLSALEDTAVNDAFSEFAFPHLENDSKENYSRASASNWAMPFAIAVAVLLVITSIFWQRDNGRSLATDRSLIEAKEEQQRRERAEDGKRREKTNDLVGQRGSRYPNWVVEKKILTLDELRGYEELLVAKGFEQEQLPDVMEVVVRLAFQHRETDSDVPNKQLMKKIMAGSEWDERQAELLVALSKRLARKRSPLDQLEKD